MKSLSSLGIGLSFVFGCLLLALVAELYYMLWWKKRIANREIEDDDYSSSPRELFYLLCGKKRSSLSSSALNPHSSSDVEGHESHDQIHLHSAHGVDFMFKPFGEEGVETEIMRLHNLAGPPRFLFTIKEETKEDLESEDGKSVKSKKGSRGRSLSDVVLAVETPFLTPLSSPPFFTPPLNPLESFKQHGINPLFESSAENEINRLRSSPPPKFKFLRDAEEKLFKKKLMEGVATKDGRNGVAAEESMVKAASVPSSKASDEGDGSFITILIGKNKEKEHHASSSQVLPLPTSPSDIRQNDKRFIFHERR